MDRQKRLIERDIEIDKEDLSQKGKKKEKIDVKRVQVR